MPDGSTPKDSPGAKNGAAHSAGSDAELDSLAEKFHANEGAAATESVLAAKPKLDELEREPDLSELRRSALGQRLAQRRGYAIAAREAKTPRLLSSWGLGGVLLLSLWALAGTRGDLAYWSSSAAPVELGHLGAYHLENATDGAYAKVEGIASPKRASYSRMFGEHELFPLIASRILVDRAQPPDDSMRGYGFQFSGEGRLVRASEGGKWDAVREQFVAADELAKSGDLWVLEEGVVPHRGARMLLEAASWLLVALACAITLARRAIKKANRPAGAASGPGAN